MSPGERGGPPALIDALVAPGPHESLGAHADTYGRFIGRWRGELVNHTSDPPRTGTVEAAFFWVLDGRAVQDVWLTPSRAGGDAGLRWHGTTLRVFDPSCEAWRVQWWDPVSQRRSDLEGRRQGDDVVQLGLRGTSVIRWTFTEVRRDSFTWNGDQLLPDGTTWRPEVTMRFHRVV